MEAFQPQVQQKSVLRRLNGAEVSHKLGGTLGDEGPALTKLFCISDAVVAVVRGTETRKFFLVGHPVELAAVHNTAAYTGPVTVHIFGGGVGDDIAAPLKGTAIDGGSKGVIHNQRDAVGVGGLGELLNVQDCKGGVGDGLAKYGLGVGLKGCV